MAKYSLIKLYPGRTRLVQFSNAISAGNKGRFVYLAVIGGAGTAYP
jgi:hypothetical protein